MSDKSVRAFLAVPLGGKLQDRLADLQRQLSRDLPGVRWTCPENLHLTLRFFGDVTHEDLEKIRVSMLSIEGCQRAFEVSATGLGSFPDPRRPRVLWVGLRPVAPLQGLYWRIQSALALAGIPKEPRPFSPHLTIGRLRQTGPDLSLKLTRAATQRYGGFPVDQLVLYESRLHPGGAEHIPLSRLKFPLCEEDAGH
ncbi:MAG: RNA 2',3'-cyclic phosphodiesterase [Desulfuromonas sp.]|nr:MAG: RNA 2',3'-cyclic phosphodiesterase [Desulfuromonas sp.]